MRCVLNMELNSSNKKEILQTLTCFRHALKQFTFSPDARKLDCYMQDSLKCACGIASYALGVLLKSKFKLKCQLAYGIYLDGKIDLENLSPNDVNHVWLSSGNYIIDVTASQFGDNEIVLRQKRRGGKETFLELFRDEVENIKNETKNWGYGQCPSKSTLKSIIRNYQDITGETISI
jgi:hypothetical protein